MASRGPGIQAGVFCLQLSPCTMPSARAALNEHRSSPFTTIRGKTLSAFRLGPTLLAQSLVAISDVRFDAHYGLKSNIAPSPNSANA